MKSVSVDLGIRNCKKSMEINKIVQKKHRMRIQLIGDMVQTNKEAVRELFVMN